MRGSSVENRYSNSWIVRG